MRALRLAVDSGAKHNVVWTAADGAEAVAACAREVPDLILMDILLPVMDGVEATRQIMATTPCAILIVSLDTADDSHLVYQALGYGALDVVAMREAQYGAGVPVAAQLVAKIETVRKLLAHGSDRPLEFGASAQGMVAIGASAGGPAALATLFSGLPLPFAAALVVVQHVDEPFVAGMAAWLSEQSVVPVRVAEEGEAPAPGTVLLAATNSHLVVKASGRLGYTKQPADATYRPSIDVFFRSVARFGPRNAIGVLLTGMGRDGAQGLKALRDGGHHTIAQDEQSSAVFGMPKAAAALGAAVEILALGRIAGRLGELGRQSAFGGVG